MAMREATRRRVRWTTVALASVLCAACSGAGNGVGVQEVDTNVIFHNAQASKTAPGATPAGVATLPPLPPLPQLPDFSFGPVPITIIVPKCPTASPFAQPAAVADSSVTTSPAKGAYEWVGTGQDTNVVNGLNLTLFVQGFATQYLRNVQQFTDPLQVPALQSAPSDDFTYDTMQPNYDLNVSGLDDLLWQVKGNSSTPNDPVGGLALMGVNVVNANGQTATPAQTLFAPPAKAGLLMLPLPVLQSSSTWTSTVPDTNGSVWQLAGTVVGRENIDECGTLVQAWHVHSVLTITNSSTGTSGSTTTLYYDVATQYGAQVIAMKIDGPWLGAAFHSAAFRDGQLTPGPLPSNISG